MAILVTQTCLNVTFIRMLPVLFGLGYNPDLYCKVDCFVLTLYPYIHVALPSVINFMKFVSTSASCKRSVQVFSWFCFCSAMTRRGMNSAETQHWMVKFSVRYSYKYCHFPSECTKTVAAVIFHQLSLDGWPKWWSFSHDSWPSRNVCTIQTLLTDFNASIPNATLTNCRVSLLFPLCCNKLSHRCSVTLMRFFKNHQYTRSATWIIYLVDNTC
jgi:hypothetical protein